MVGRDAKGKTSNNLRKRSGSPTTTKDGESQDEHHDLGSTVQGRGDDVVVLDEELGTLLAEVPLREESQEVEHADG